MTNTSNDISVPVFEIDQPEAYGQYILHNAREIAFHLESLQLCGAFATLYLNDGGHFFLSRLLAITDAGRLLLDPPSHAESLRLAISATRITLAASIERIKIQCRLSKLEMAQHEGRVVLAASMPESMLRLQRREYFRIETPQVTPLRCRFARRHADGRAEAFDLPLHDISGGGLCLTGDDRHADKFSLGEIFADCRLDIPGESVLSVNLRVREISRVEAVNGEHQLRLGCEFYNLPGTRLTLIERYITRLERERKARASGLA